MFLKYETSNPFYFNSLSWGPKESRSDYRSFTFLLISNLLFVFFPIAFSKDFYLTATGVDFIYDTKLSRAQEVGVGGGGYGPTVGFRNLVGGGGSILYVSHVASTNLSCFASIWVLYRRFRSCSDFINYSNYWNFFVLSSEFIFSTYRG